MAESPLTQPITFAVATHGSGEILKSNFLNSPALKDNGRHEILIQKDFASASAAYNDAICRSSHDLIAFVHQDVILPRNWLLEVNSALDCLQIFDPKWGVVGCYGRNADGQGCGHVYAANQGLIGGSFARPARVQTLDEIVLIIRKSSGLAFDIRLPHFHMYGADLCLMAAKQAMASYAISAFCIHNTNQYLVFPREFYECCAYIKRKWRSILPILTPCITITAHGLPLYKRRLREMRFKMQGKTFIATRQEDVHRLIAEADLSRNSDRRATNLPMTSVAG
ncbi:MAG: glycosyltransferase family protein [Acidobacteriota bacterium]|nr:glycosyltransferase family protein [Acidobacteriota bacterium]